MDVFVILFLLIMLTLLVLGLDNVTEIRLKEGTSGGVDPDSCIDYSGWG